jgi:hypothetical protein
MPEICRFFGMVITMYFNDHDPPHFHVRYGHARAAVAIESLRLLVGFVSRTKRKARLTFASSFGGIPVR